MLWALEFVTLLCGEGLQRALAGQKTWNAYSKRPAYSSIVDDFYCGQETCKFVGLSAFAITSALV